MSAHLGRDDAAGIAMLDASDPERVAAEQHARDCAECRARLDGASATLAALDALAPAPPPPPEVLARAKSAVLVQLSPGASSPTEASSASGDPDPELSAARPRTAIGAALTVPALAIAAFVGLALALRPVTEIAWGVSLAVLAIVAGRTAIALLRGTARDGAFSLALGVGASIVLVMVDAEGAGHTTGMECIAVELFAAALPLLTATGLAWRGAMRPSALGLAAIASTGALAGQLALRASCPDSDFDHLAAFHVGGVVAAALAGAISSRLPPLRRRADAP